MKFFALFLFLPFLSFSQEVITCKDSTNYIVNKINDNYLTIKTKGEINRTENPQVLVLNNNIIIQSLINNVTENKENGNTDVAILATYILKEGNYFSSIFKHKVDLAMFPIDLENAKKAIFWHFDLPKSENIKNEVKAIKNVFISVVKNEYIYTIGTTLFENQKIEFLEKLLTEMIKTVEQKKGKKDLCKE